MTPQSILETRKYQDWISKFGPHTSHIILNENTAACYSPSNIRNKLDARLCSINPVLFPVAWDKEKHLKQNLPNNCIEGEKCLEFHFFPQTKKGFCKDNIYKPNFRRRHLKSSKEKGLYSDFHGLNEEQRSAFYNTHVTFLGTAASKQSKLRGTSSILVELR